MFQTRNLFTANVTNGEGESAFFKDDEDEE